MSSPRPPGCGPARSLDASAGYSTGEGFRLEAAWEHRNLFRPEGALRIAAIAGTAEQNLSVRFRRNNWGQRDRALLLQFDRRRNTRPPGSLHRASSRVDRQNRAGIGLPA